MTIGESITLDDLETDPYPIYARLRDDEPVAWVPAVGLWLVTRFEDVQHVDQAPEVFSAETDLWSRRRSVHARSSPGPAT